MILSRGASSPVGTYQGGANPGSSRGILQSVSFCRSLRADRTARLKICHVSNLYPPDVLGGAETVVSQLVQGLREAGHAVTVIGD